MKSNTYQVVLIGGGASGFYAAIQLRMLGIDNICILEKTHQVLQKVRISGGGRCNVTHGSFDPNYLAEYYPRGSLNMKHWLKLHQPKDVMAFFESQGVPLKIEQDGRVFPVSDDSNDIVQCLLRLAKKYSIDVQTQTDVQKIALDGTHTFTLKSKMGAVFKSKAVCVCIGGASHDRHYQWIQSSNIEVKAPIPSLFTFNESSKTLSFLQGISIRARIQILGFEREEIGSILFTHWGLSGPAAIRLSAWAAIFLHQKQYEYVVILDLIPDKKEHEVAEILKQSALGTTKLAQNVMPIKLPDRLWRHLLQCSAIDPMRKAAEIGHKKWNTLAALIKQFEVVCKGKTTFKEEFVTCGGISLDAIDNRTMNVHHIPGLFAAGEVLDVDGVTGGFNFQAAWTTAYIAAHGIHTFLTSTQQS